MNRIEANASVVNRTVRAGNGDVTVTRTVSLDYNDLINKPEIPDSTSDLINDSGFISSETDPVFVASPAHGITSADIASWNGKSDFSGAYADLTGKPTIPTVPTNVSAFNNDAGYLTSVPSEYVTETEMQTALASKADTADIPTAVSDLTNDSGYITSAGAPVQSVNGQTGAVTVSVPVSSVNGRTGAVTGLAEQWTVQNMTASDTAVTLQPNVFYIFPEMASLAVTVTAVGMYAFRFTSGTTATTLTVNGATMPDSFSVESGKVYEVNVYQGYGVVSEWTT